MSSAAAMASAASGIARRSRVCSLDGLARSRSFRATPPASPPGVAPAATASAGSLHSAAAGQAPRLMRCRSLTTPPSSATRRAYAGAASVTSAARRGEADACNDKPRAEGGRFLAGAVAVAGALAASATAAAGEEDRAGSSNGQARAGGMRRSSAAGGSRVWCHGSASTRFPSSLGSFGDQAASRRADLRKNSWSSTSSSSASSSRGGGGGGGGGESDVEQVDASALDRGYSSGSGGAGMSSARITDVYRFEGNGEPVGRGNRSIVSTATHRLTGQPVAVKRLSRAETTRLEVMEEVNMLKVAGRHPNVVTMQAFFEDREAYYIVMEMCEGGELYHRLADKGRYSEGQAARIMAEVASAVGFLHGKGIIHFDLKPENIMLAVGGDDCVPEVRLADFGSAFRQYRQIRIARDYTAAYSAPEVLARESVDEKVDMWALGVVMWIMLTGQHPFGANSDLSEAEVARRVTEMEPDLKVLRHVSPEGKDLVRRLLARDPEDRPSARRVLSHPWLRAVVTRSKVPNPAIAVASHRGPHPRLARRLQQQHQRHSRPLEGSWGRVVPTPRAVSARAGAGTGVGSAPGTVEGEEGKGAGGGGGGGSGGGGGGGGGGGIAESSTVAAVVASVTGGDHLSA